MENSKNIFNTVNHIESCVFYPNRKNPEYNICNIIYRDKDDHPWLIYVDCIKTKIEIVQDTTEYDTFNSLVDDTKTNKLTTTEIIHTIIPDNNNVLFTLIDLVPPKKMTKKEIENKLGYTIDIVE